MPAYYIGLMSGTSMDGIDAVLCEFEQQKFTRATHRYSLNYPDALRARLLRLQRDEPALTLSEFCEMDNAVAALFAAAATALIEQAGLERAGIVALGSHGQTVFHDPLRVGSSIQLGNPSLIAALSGITTVADFRRADIARHGQGAPLVPAFHHAVFSAAGETRCVVNIGGIANLTVLRGNDPRTVLGFDTGPGNGLMDEWIEKRRGQAFDAEGNWARSGQLEPVLVDTLFADEYFHQPPPKSTGRGYFNLAWVERRCGPLDQRGAAQVQRSLCELTAHSISESVLRCAPDCQQALLCGGGARNRFLLERLRSLLPKCGVTTTDAFGLAAGDVEAAAFAWLAMRTLHQLPGNLPAATGASSAAVLGGIYRA